jgi:hypothetical protein
MQLPSMTTRRSMIAVAVVALTTAILSVRSSSGTPPTKTRQPVFDPTGEVNSIEPPAWRSRILTTTIYQRGIQGIQTRMARG